MSDSQLDDMMRESGVARDEVDALAAVLSPLAALGDEAVPAPSAELMRLFGEAAPGATSLAERRSLQQRRQPHRTRGTVAGVVVLALSGVGATGMSAAANTLPSSFQHHVAGFSRHYLPFDFPEPVARAKDSAGHSPGARRTQGSEDDVLGERRVQLDGATRSDTREELAATGAPTWHAVNLGPSGAASEPRAGNAPGSSPRGEEDETPTTGETESSAEEPSRGAHGSQDGRGQSKGPDGHGDDETGNDQRGQSDRPVKGGGVGGPKDGQKGPQKGPQKSPQKGSQPGSQPGTPGGGVDQGEPGQGQSGGGSDAGSGSPGGSGESPTQPEPGDQGSTGPQGEPANKDDATGDALSRLTGGVQSLLGG